MKTQTQDREELRALRHTSFSGLDIVDVVVRLCAVNLYEEPAKRDKLNLDAFWLKDDSLKDIDSLPEPDVLAAEIVENLAAALEQFRSVSAELTEEAAE